MQCNWTLYCVTVQLRSCLLLFAGKVKSTEETYKYHMQILEQQPEPVKRQQPLKAILKPAPGANSSLPTSPVESAAEEGADLSFSQMSNG